MPAPSQARRTRSTKPAGTPIRLPRAHAAIAAVVVIGAALVLAFSTWRWTPGSLPPPTPEGPRGAPTDRPRASGEELYATFCATCHGPEGRGDGPAAPLCRLPPADFTRAEFKVRSTAMGALPRDQDLRDVILGGAGGDGAMPPFDILEPADIDQLVARIKTFSSRWQREPPPAELVLPRRRGGDAARGGQLYQAWGCAACHGAKGAGDGPRAGELRTARGLPDVPTDLRRPWTFKAGADEPALARSVLTGFSGTTMPGLPLVPGLEDALWHLAAFLRSLQQPEAVVESRPVETATVRGYWSTPVPHQRGDLSAVSCAACHSTQFRDWLGTRHAVAMSPGVWAQMKDQPELSGNCLGCHAPLREQWTDDYLMSDGVSCGVCHARDGQTFGPPPRPTTLAPLVARFPASHGAANVRDFFESAEFCARCHQFGDGDGPKVNGKFLENTVEEWRASRAAREGKTCQGCHMPDRRHAFRGIHDADTVRSGVRWTFSTGWSGNRLQGRLTLTNTDTGHAFPSYVVPEVWMRIELVDQLGVGTLVAEKLIGRQAVVEQGQWRELSDTRLLQDETATLTYSGVPPPGATAIVGSVVVRPDAYHVRSLAANLRQARTDESRRLYEQALAEIRQSDYVLFREVRDVPR